MSKFGQRSLWTTPYLDNSASLNSQVFLLFQVLYNQFKFFLNLFFLIMATSQFIPQLRIGYIYTYWAPLGFVIAVTMIREAIDDFRRYQRDKEVNGSRYTKLTNRGKISLPSSDLKVGDIIYVEKGHRVPADMILLRTTETSGMWWPWTNIYTIQNFRVIKQNAKKQKKVGFDGLDVGAEIQ